MRSDSPHRRVPALLSSIFIGVMAAGCAGGCSVTPAVTATDDMGALATPDLAPIALYVEPAAPTLDPACPVNKPVASDVLDEALKQVNLDRCTYTFPAAANLYYPADLYRLPFFSWAHDHPVNAPSFARTTIKHLDEAAASATPIATQLVLLGDRLGPPISTALTPFAPDAAQPLSQAVAQLITATGGAPDTATLVADAADVPMDLQNAVAQLVLAVNAANADWNELTKDLSADDLSNLAGTSSLVLSQAGFVDPSDPATKMLLTRRWNEHDLLAGGARLAAAVEVLHLARFAKMKGFSFDQKTPIGRIVIHDGGDDSYPDDKSDAIALLLDTGGNDSYQKGVGAVGTTQMVGSNLIHVALAIDLDGVDDWGYDPMPIKLDGKRLPSDSDGRDNSGASISVQTRQGAAILGYGYLFDYGTGGDHYHSLRMSQGFGVAGVGVLYDEGGDDLYEGEAGMQGGGIFGAGILLDAAGNDTYKVYSYAQGFGYVRGAGLLYDQAGNDKYLSDSGEPRLGGDPLYGSPQLPCTSKDGMGNRLNCGNSSFTQGVGFGRRDDATHANMSGGLGIIRDVAGDDVYTTSVFGQGSAYWIGTGILADGAGNDQYDGFWYVQGSDAHGGLCVFIDDAGDDKYNQSWPMFPPYSTAIGQGHDFSLGWHLDLGGNDTYRAPNLSLGSGNANGAGALINIGGTDTFVSSSAFTLGGASSDPSAMRNPGIPTYGLFVHTGANATYTVPADAHLTPQPAAGASWSYKADVLPVIDVSVGIDRATGNVSLP